MKKLIIKKLSDNSIIEEIQVADHDEFQWVKENKERFGQDDVFEEKQVLVKEAWVEMTETEGGVMHTISHEAIYETVKELVTPKDWYVETVDMTEENDGKDKKKKEAKKRLKKFDIESLDKATTIKGLRDSLKELIKDIVEASE